MGLVVGGEAPADRFESGDTSGSTRRLALRSLGALLAGVAAIALSASFAQAQQVAQTLAQTDGETAQGSGGGTLLDKILLTSRTGETAIESLSS